MPDLLVSLYRLPPLSAAVATANAAGVEIRRALVPERPVILPWVEAQFSKAWAAECDAAFARMPAACFVATRDGELCGFVAYEATCRNFLGPLGVEIRERGGGIGAALLLAALHAMQAEGYAYAIIGGAGPVEFFQKVAGAVEIADSVPGIYHGMLRAPRAGGDRMLPSV